MQRDTINQSTAAISSSTMDEFREGCLKLEKARHSRVYEAEKRLLYLEHSIMMSYALEVASALDEHLMSRHVATMKALAENAEKIRRVEERRFGIDTHQSNSNHQQANGTIGDGFGYSDAWQQAATGTGNAGGTTGSSKKHDMALRGRAAEDRFRIDDDILYDSERARRSRKGDHRNQKVKVQIELEENDVLADLEELRGEKRPREADTPVASNGPERERKAKKKK